MDIGLGGGRTPWLVHFQSSANDACASTFAHVTEVLAVSSVESPKVGFSARDVDGVRPFRAYIIPGVLNDVHDSTYVHCVGAHSPYVPGRCMVLGSAADGCFTVGIYGTESADDLRMLSDLIRENWPQSLKASPVE